MLSHTAGFLGGRDKVALTNENAARTAGKNTGADSLWQVTAGVFVCVCMYECGCVTKVQSHCFASGTWSNATLEAGCNSQEVLLLFLVLGLLFRISSSWSLSQSLWNNQNGWAVKQLCNCLCVNNQIFLLPAQSWDLYVMPRTQFRADHIQQLCNGKMKTLGTTCGRLESHFWCHGCTAHLANLHTDMRLLMIFSLNSLQTCQKLNSKTFRLLRCYILRNRFFFLPHQEKTSRSALK